MEKIKPKMSESHINRYISKQRYLLLISVGVHSKYRKQDGISYHVTTGLIYPWLNQSISVDVLGEKHLPRG